MKKILLSTIFALALFAMHAQTILYVKPDGSGDGKSWATAGNLESVIRSLIPSASLRINSVEAQIWAQKGTYFPKTMITIPENVKLFGGFSGTETSLEQRDLSTNSTIIDAQNKFGSVIRMEKSSELNGFTIQNGYAYGNPQKHGGGVWATDNAVIANCIIINNSAYAGGGGLFAQGCDVKVINSTIKNNTSKGSGGNTFGNCVIIETDADLLGRSSKPTPIVAVPCTSETFNFGKISFATAGERTIIGNGITQIWSGPVTTSNCAGKETFNGGTTGNYMIDCRSNPNYPGDLFSWCAIDRYKGVLCPAPWRVPSKDDFINLDKAMGGTGANRTGAIAELPKYIGTGTNQWGGAYGGYANAGSLDYQGLNAYYWSQTEGSADNGYYLHLSTGGNIYPQTNYLNKYLGFPLRCVR